MSEGVKPTAIFWVVGILALVWNLMGVVAYLSMTMVPAQEFAEAYGQAFADILATKPAWATAAFAVGVFGGVLGCLALLIRKSWAKILFILSFLGVIIHNIWGFMAGSFDAVGTFDKIMTFAVMLICIFLIWFSSRMISQGVLR